MKLRIQDGSLRLRLSQTDLRQLAGTGGVESEMRVGPGAALTYGLRAAACDRLTVELDRATLTVLVPLDWVEEWTGSGRVGFEGAHDAGDGRTLSVLVEKDFDCFHRRPDEDDLFPHPDADAR